MADNNDAKNEIEEDETNTIVTMVDVLKAEEFLEENAMAVLGSADDKNCTYSEGYVNRQALYSCLTCLPADGKDRAGVCLACSYHCHADHDLVELYTKRNFRCDCGNSRFKSSTCKLESEKEYSNELNRYNKNFEGLYCSCSRPYPDPEKEEDDLMIQCTVCEDWFHSKHLGCTVPKEEEYAELICGPCTDSLPFLQYYLGYSVKKVSESTDKESEVDVVNGSLESKSTGKDEKENVLVNGTVVSTSTDKENEVVVVNKSIESRSTEKENGVNGSMVSTSNDKISKDIVNGNIESKSTDKEEKENVANGSLVSKSTGKEEEGDIVVNGNENVHETSQQDCTNDSTAAQNQTGSKSSDSKECKLKLLKKLQRESGATFWPQGSRKLFCTCPSCLDMYKSSNVSFLTDEDDTVDAYEARGKARKAQAGAGATQYEMGMEALSSLDRVQQMEAILSYNEMKTHLSEYLTKFVENKKVVREEDIREFFTGMQARKRQKLDIPYTCR